MTHRRSGAAALVAAGALLAAGTAVAGAAPVDLRPCSSQPGDPTRCGRVVVPLDRAGRLPGRVSLFVRVLPPVGGGRASGTVVALAGGPGQAATPLIPDIAQALGMVVRGQRLVTFDQRGTGRSGRLSCPSLAEVRRRSQTAAAVGACARRLGPARVAYTTSASVDDVEAVRAALGAERIALYGVSYGSKVALNYATRFPARTTRVVLDSAVLPGGVDPFMRATFGSVPRVLREVCGRACPFTRDPGADVAALVARMTRAGPVHGRWFDGRGRPHRAAVGSVDLLDLLLGGDFDAALRAAAPAAVTSALGGDGGPLARLVKTPRPGPVPTSDSDALFWATSCADGGEPWPDGTPVSARPAAAAAALAAVPPAQLYPFDAATLRGSGLFDGCREWPESPIPQAFGPLPPTPALLLSGDQDLRTPRVDATALAAALPAARLVTVPRVGHSVLPADTSGCARAQTERFFAGRVVVGCRGAGPPRVPPSRPPPTRLGALPARGGLPPKLGRTVTAVELTLADFGERQRIVAVESGAARLAFGGLRGGFATLTATRARLVAYSYVPGVTASLDVRAGEPVAVTVGGRDAAHGTLVFGGGAISGTLDGRPVRLSRPGAARLALHGHP